MGTKSGTYPPYKKMKTALFTNFTNEDFTGYWDGRPKTVKAGQSTYMPEYLARHFAKHITNRELLRTDKDGNLIIKGGDKATSPKVKTDRATGKEFIDDKLFLSIFNKAFKPEENEGEGDIADKGDSPELHMAVAEKNRKLNDGKGQTNIMNETRTNEEVKRQDERTKPAQVIVPPDFNEDDDEEFGEKPKG